MSEQNGNLLRVRVEPLGDGLSVVSLTGELDLGTIPDLEAPLFEELRTRTGVVVDLTELVFIDSSGIGLLIKASGLRSDPGAMHIAIASGSQVERVFGLTGVDRALPVTVGSDQALAALRGRDAEPNVDRAG